MKKNHDLVDLKLKLHHQTVKAVLLSETGRAEDAKWVPLSQIEMEPDGKGFVDVTMPEWLAEKIGFA